ncbi:hypothetical protein FKP32DRAFT_1588509, partial [Trametes sanguinea]
MNLSAMYSPTTGRKVSLSNGQGKAGVQIVPGTTAAKRPYKRGTSVACMSCRKRKVACGGPQEGDEEGRCGDSSGASSLRRRTGSSVRGGRRPGTLVPSSCRSSS